MNETILQDVRLYTDSSDSIINHFTISLIAFAYLNRFFQWNCQPQALKTPSLLLPPNDIEKPVGEFLSPH